VGTPGLVTISAGRVNPDTITVSAGRPITFQNDDATPHQIVSNEQMLFDTGPIAPGASAQVTVTAQGFHDFHDAANPALKGTIRILP
jgi:plastocyanin